LPLFARWLIGLIRGDGAEYVRGDLEEEYRRRAFAGESKRVRWAIDVLLTVLAWWNPASARRRSRLRGERGQGVVRNLGGDAAQAVRLLVRRPAFAAVAVATLGLGVGAPATIYSVVDAVMVRDLPYTEADRLVVVGHTFPGREWVEGTDLQALERVGGPTVRDWGERVRTLVAIEAVELRTVLIPDGVDGPRLVPTVEATRGVLDLLGARLHLGRGFLPEDMRGDAQARNVILSHGAWMRRTGGDPAILGRTAPGLGGSVVIGVLHRDFEPPEAIFGRSEYELWSPLDPTNRRYANREERRLNVIGRLAGGATAAGARAELSSIQAAIAREFPDGTVYPDGTALGAGVNTLHAQTVGSSGRMLLLFLASSVLLLLIAAINTANLLLVRGLDRERELAVRLALGASRWRVARSALVESLVLALAGGAVGLLLAWGGVTAFVRFVPESMPRLGEVALNGRIVVIGVIGSLLVGAAAGLLPALAQSDRTLRLQRSARLTASRSGVRLRMMLVAAQLGLAAVLGVGASLLFRSFVNVAAADPGFEAENVTTFAMPLKRPGGQALEAWRSWDELVDHVRGPSGLPVAAASNLPFQAPNWAPSFQLWEDEPTSRRAAGAGYVMTPDYFDVMRIPLEEGRVFSSADGPSTRAVTIANRAFADAFFAGRDAIGQRIRVWNEDGGRTEVEIVGVVGNTVQTRVEEGTLPALWFPYTQVEWPIVHVVVRSDRDATALAADLRAAAARFSPSVPRPAIERVTDRIRDARTEPRFRALLFLSFASVALLLAAVGLYGTLAHAVSRRTRELGIRMAVGADRRRIFGMVLGEGTRVIVLGLSFGILAAALVTRVLRGFLFGVEPLDVATFAASAALMLVVGGLATLSPARRATGVDPMDSLRAD
jgi:putative ABC transport system permease protein